VLKEKKFRDDNKRNLKEHFEIVFWVDVLNVWRNVCLTSGCYYSKIPLVPFPPENRSADLWRYSGLPDRTYTRIRLNTYR